MSVQAVQPVCLVEFLPSWPRVLPAHCDKTSGCFIGAFYSTGDGRSKSLFFVLQTQPALVYILGEGIDSDS